MQPVTPASDDLDTPLGVKPEVDGHNYAGGTTSTPRTPTIGPSLDGNEDDLRTKPKQKRNKPTLSCLECVERKTKCDRGRPCIACVKRQSNCEYTPVANLLASADRKNSSGSKARYISKPPNKVRKTSNASSSLISPVTTDNGWTHIDQRAHRNSRSSSDSSPFLLSNVPFAKSSPSNVFGVGSQHPFSNYWTCAGGLPEVIGVMPSKEQADILVAKYFEVVDPVYPFLHRQAFYADYERYWALPIDARGQTDASFAALLYAIYALGTQFVQFPSYTQRSQTAEFYCSAANQALRVYSYLNRTSLRAIQAMLLMAYFLMNDNHASDAYAWAGIHLRQSYAMRLHRDPDLVVPEASVLEKQARRKLWQAVFFQDTFLTVLLKLPPTATHSDVPVDSLAEENELSTDGLDTCLAGAHSRTVENLMSISVIAPQSPHPQIPIQPLPHHIASPEAMKSDVVYLRSMWHLGNLVQENLSSPCSLSLPLATSPRHKDGLIATFRRLYKSFPTHLTTLDYATLQAQTQTNPRQVRQNLFLTSNYYHCLTLLYAAENAPAGVSAYLRPALEAAHEAIWAFFKLWDFFESEAGVWWVFQHRAFEEALLIAHLLTTIPSPTEQANGDAGVGVSAVEREVYEKAKEDVRRMLGIMERYCGSLEMHATRKEVLVETFGRVVI